MTLLYYGVKVLTPSSSINKRIVVLRWPTKKAFSLQQINTPNEGVAKLIFLELNDAYKEFEEQGAKALY